MDKITVKNLYKVFGDSPEKAIDMLNKGEDKGSIFEKTGMTVGVNNATFSVKAGEIFVIMGLSGSGKSTIVRMLNRLIEPSAGQVFVDDNEVTKLSHDELVQFRLRNMSMVFQSFALMPHLSVLENASFGLKLAKVDEKKCKDRAMQALEQVGLKGWENSYPNQLSGGMQQRVGLARGLAVDPDVLLMDEAFSALDPLIRTEMQDELIKLQEKDKRTIVFISHDLDEALRIGDRIAIMEGGRVVQVGTPEDILQNPADDYVRAFFRGVDPTNVISAGDIVRKTHPTIIVTKEGNMRAAHEILSGHDRNHGYVLNSDHQYMGTISSSSLLDAMEKHPLEQSIKFGFIDQARPVNMNESMQDILPEIASKTWPIPVVDDENHYMGVVSKNRFLKTLHKTENEATS